jgi:hypothetical protein
MGVQAANRFVNTTHVMMSHVMLKVNAIRQPAQTEFASLDLHRQERLAMTMMIQHQMIRVMGMGFAEEYAQCLTPGLLEET